MATYQAVYYEEIGMAPAFRVVEVLEGNSSEEVLLQNLPRLITTVREWYGLDSESFSDESLLDSLMVLPDDSLTLASSVVHRSERR